MVKIKKAAPAQPTPTSSQERDRELDRVKHEFGRLMMAVDTQKRYGTVSSLGAVSDILRCCYLLIDATDLP